jgi:hypothetical protein
MPILHDLRTLFHLSREVTRLSARVEELELEWLDKRDALDRILRRLTMRDVRTKPEELPLVNSAASNHDPSSSKDQLRTIARSRGML